MRGESQEEQITKESLGALADKVFPDVDEHSFDDEFDGDFVNEPELTTYAYEQLYLQRVHLKYLRLTEFELPTFTRFHKPFVPPSSKHIVRIRTQHYQGEEHPADRKCALTVHVPGIPNLEDWMRHKFRVLAGPRWYPEEDMVKISCELFPELEMNEKWCNDTLNKLLTVAKEGEDKMLDVPLDTRAAEKRKKVKRSRRAVEAEDFPLEWLPTPSQYRSAVPIEVLP
ncbi:hypothetical protein BT69DRAFT_1216941 [Atractiella rhizophila]|nr:hypothetical protein BT69DRAFT_1216941 [Atractiella rhizophila]